MRLTQSSDTLALPELPALGADDLQLVRLVLTPGPFKSRARMAGIPAARISGAHRRVCDLLGATHLPQAGAIAAAHRLFTSADLNLPQLRGPLHLAPRKQRAMELLISGLEDDQIALELQVAPDTARGYLTDTVTDLGGPRRPQAAFTAIATGTLALSVISPLYPHVHLTPGAAR
ncbi:hypothetical protein [Kitasatospora aureofaciens]|uniref:hypothetical protein n=1 Tax=Kitasatospora aureofaciens TaxID=1894 RepID=UPI00052534C0|nr:hypothetical protein [Kitasatospora aureofaciens]